MEKPQAVLVLVHGLGAHSQRWDFLSDYFKNKDFSIYSLDLKGFGKSEGPRGHIDSFKTYYKDIAELAIKAKKENPGKKIFLIGESMGGLISFNLGADNPHLFSGIILLSPAFKNAMKFKLSDYLKLIYSLFTNPKNTITMPFNSRMCTRDEAYADIMDKNPLELRIASAKLLVNILIEQIKAKFYAKKIKAPLLFMLSGKDFLVDEKENKKFFNALKIKDKKIIEYIEMHHALSIDLGREKVFEDIYNWLQERI